MDQRDPTLDPRPRDRRDFIRRDDGSYSIMPIALVAAFVLVLGYLLLGNTFRTNDTTRPVTSQNAPVTRAAPPASTPAPNPAPKNP